MAFMAVPASAAASKVWRMAGLASRNRNTVSTGGGGPPAAAGSNVPRDGSRKVSSTSSDTATPVSPMTTKELRQPWCSVSQPPSIEPPITPKGAPSQMIAIADARRAMG